MNYNNYVYYNDIAYRKRQQEPSTVTEVIAENIILRDIRDNDQNEVEFSMFVQINNGASVLSADTLLATIMVLK